MKHMKNIICFFEKYGSYSLRKSAALVAVDASSNLVNYTEKKGKNGL